jgi:hypothetical protein
VADARNLWDEVPDWGGVGARRLVRPERGSLGASLWEFQPGGSQFVYHFHHGSDDELARVLIVSSSAGPDIAEYPETGKVGIATGDSNWEYFRRDDAVPPAGPE